MTALKPLENRNVRGVKASKYPLNEKCAHPECSEPTADGHHCFPRSEIGNALWFVELLPPGVTLTGSEQFPVIPHVSGLCRAHHDDVEDHRAWIKLEDGQFVWYERHAGSHNANQWHRVGPLNPQPGSREGKPKRKRFKGEARRQRKTISIKVPQDADEDGAGIFDELLVQCREQLGVENDFPVYHTLCAVIYDWLTS